MDSVSGTGNLSRNINIICTQDNSCENSSSSSKLIGIYYSSSKSSDIELINRVSSINKRLSDMASSLSSITVRSEELSSLAMERIDNYGKKLCEEEIKILQEIASDKEQNHINCATSVSNCSYIKSSISFLATPLILKIEEKECKIFDTTICHSGSISEKISHPYLNDEAGSKLSEDTTHSISVAINEANVIHSKSWRFLKTLYKSVGKLTSILTSLSIADAYSKEINNELFYLHNKIKNSNNKKNIESMKVRIRILENRKEFVSRSHSLKKDKFNSCIKSLLSYMSVLEKSDKKIKSGIENVISYKKCVYLMEAHHIIFTMLESGHNFLRRDDVIEITDPITDFN